MKFKNVKVGDKVFDKFECVVATVKEVNDDPAGVGGTVYLDYGESEPVRYVWVHHDEIRKVRDGDIE